jgi:hypothetical protein
MDEIIVISGGRAIERGSHAELLAKGGVYRKLWDDQSHGRIKQVRPMTTMMTTMTRTTTRRSEHGRSGAPALLRIAGGVRPAPEKLLATDREMPSDSRNASRAHRFARQTGRRRSTASAGDKPLPGKPLRTPPFRIVIERSELVGIHALAGEPARNEGVAEQLDVVENLGGAGARGRA